MKEQVSKTLGRVEQMAESLSVRFDESPEKFDYHNFDHCFEVSQKAGILARKLELTESEVELMEIAGLYHDSGLIDGERENHEARGAEMARQDMIKLGFLPEDIRLVEETILATRGEYVKGVWQASPADIFGEIICDADLWVLGDKNFPEESEKLRLELGVNDKLEWYRSQKIFIDGHQWHTSAAKALWEEQKQANIVELGEVIGSLG